MLEVCKDGELCKHMDCPQRFPHLTRDCQCADGICWHDGEHVGCRLATDNEIAEWANDMRDTITRLLDSMIDARIATDAMVDVANTVRLHIDVVCDRFTEDGGC